MPLCIASSTSLLEMGLAKYLVGVSDGHFAAVVVHTSITFTFILMLLKSSVKQLI